MSDTLQRLLASYQRGVITGQELANALVIVATERFPSEFTGEVPPEVLELLRGIIARAEEPAFVFLCIRKSDAERAAELRLWREGLDRWREYFEIAG